MTTQIFENTVSFDINVTSGKYLGYEKYLLNENEAFSGTFRNVEVVNKKLTLQHYQGTGWTGPNSFSSGEYNSIGYGTLATSWSFKPKWDILIKELNSVIYAVITNPTDTFPEVNNDLSLTGFLQLSEKNSGNVVVTANFETPDGSAYPTYERTDVIKKVITPVILKKDVEYNFTVSVTNKKQKNSLRIGSNADTVFNTRTFSNFITNTQSNVNNRIIGHPNMKFVTVSGERVLSAFDVQNYNRLTLNWQELAKNGATIESFISYDEGSTWTKVDKKSRIRNTANSVLVKQVFTSLTEQDSPSIESYNVVGLDSYEINENYDYHTTLATNALENRFVTLVQQAGFNLKVTSEKYVALTTTILETTSGDFATGTLTNIGASNNQLELASSIYTETLSKSAFSNSLPTGMTSLPAVNYQREWGFEFTVGNKPLNISKLKWYNNDTVTRDVSIHIVLVSNGLHYSSSSVNAPAKTWGVVNSPVAKLNANTTYMIKVRFRYDGKPAVSGTDYDNFTFANNFTVLRTFKRESSPDTGSWYAYETTDGTVYGLPQFDFTVDEDRVGYVTSGERIKSYLVPGETNDFLIDWIESKPTGTDLTVSYGYDGLTWTPTTKGSRLAFNPDYTTLYVKQNLTTTDQSVTPILDDLRIEFRTLFAENGFDEKINFNASADDSKVATLIAQPTFYTETGADEVVIKATKDDFIGFNLDAQIVPWNKTVLESVVPFNPMIQIRLRGRQVV